MAPKTIPPGLARLLEEAVATLGNHQASLVPVLGVAIEAAKALGLDAEQRWFELELSGYAPKKGRGGLTSLGEVLGVPESSDIPSRITRYRMLDGHFYLQAAGSPPQQMPFAYFFDTSLPDVESQLNRGTGAVALTTVIPVEGLPPFIIQGLQQIGITPQPLTVYFNPGKLAGIVSGLRAELARFLTSVRVVLSSSVAESRERIRPNDAQSSSSSNVQVGNVTGQTVTIVAASGNSQVSVSAATKRSVASALAGLRDEIASIQDLVIANRKDLLAIEAQQDAIKRALIDVVDEMERRLKGTAATTTDELIKVASDAIASTTAKSPSNTEKLKLIVGHGITSSLIASVIFEAARKLPEFAAILGGLIGR